ncbi:MAG: phosphotransferase enzyme family protein [Oscillospiraceae bacterium]
MQIENICLAQALGAFPFEGKIVALEPFGSGHINDTYAVYTEKGGSKTISYILQRLNTHVFTRPREVMENIAGVTNYLHKGLPECEKEAGRSVLRFLQTADGEYAYYDTEGMPWRSYCFIAQSYCYNQSPSPDVFYESARAFGSFLHDLRDYPAETLHETIPRFHDTPNRLQQLKDAVQQDPMGRVATCEAEIEFALQREKDCALLTDMAARGELPLRVTHNDTKLNNVLFDEETNRALCVIDLDTIMPGLALYDFGDSIRFGATTAAEDEEDLSKVQFSLPLYEAYTKGYLETAGKALTPAEKFMLPQSARILTLECGMRFLADYIMGDSYFKVSRPGQNLARCRTQFTLAQQMEHAMDEMAAIAERYDNQ